MNQPIVWIDLELTGLNPKTDKIIEIAIIISDGQLQNIVEGPNLIINAEKSILDSMDSWCINTHGKSGLT